ncbi:MAG: hypothetical protein ACK4MF_01930, partial [Hyphomicrobiaceae bacterium]
MDGRKSGLPVRQGHGLACETGANDDESTGTLSQRLGINRDIISAQMRLTHLAPDIVRALVLG